MVNLKDYDKIDLEYRLGEVRAVLDGEEQMVPSGETLKISRSVRRIALKPELINFNVTDPDISCYLEGYDQEEQTVPYSQLVKSRKFYEYKWFIALAIPAGLIAVFGAEILKNFTGLDHVVEGAQYHHERYDGKGYTHGLKGEEIPLYGRIIGVADAFDAMTSNRVYRGHLDLHEVLAELERCRGTQFDPKIADIMIRLVKEGKIDLSELYGEIRKNQEN